MKHWKERILQMKFGRVVRRLVIFSVCAVLLEGILSVVLLCLRWKRCSAHWQRRGGFWCLPGSSRHQCAHG